MISKELLSEVLGYGVLDVMNERLNNNNLFYTTNNSDISKRFSPYIPSINIYELSHKCKKWAYTQGYSYLGNNKLCNIHSKDATIIALTNNDINKWYDINIDFIACQWILDNKDKQ